MIAYTNNIVGIMRFYNEMPENLPRAALSLRKVCRYVIGYDDGSTDDWREHSPPLFDLTITGNENCWEEETKHRAQLLEQAYKFQPDWILQLDADEEL